MVTQPGPHNPVARPRIELKEKKEKKREEKKKGQCEARETDARDI
jgi:hypothetical protein